MHIFTIGLQLPDEVESVGALCLLRVQQQRDGGAQRYGDVGPLLIPVQAAPVPSRSFTIQLALFITVV